MSTCEYNDLFFKCQDTGKYKVFVFDIVNSKLMNPDKRYHLQLKLIRLAEAMYKKIKEIEQQTNKSILVFEKNFIQLADNKRMTEFGLKREPFIIGDMFGFTIYRDSLNDKKVLAIFHELKVKLEIEAEFHINSGYYETNDYELGNELYFRGYCIDFVANMHKEHNKQLIKRLKK